MHPGPSVLGVVDQRKKLPVRRRVIQTPRMRRMVLPGKRAMGSAHLNVLEVHERPDAEVGGVLAQDGAAELAAACQGGRARRRF